MATSYSKAANGRGNGAGRGAPNNSKPSAKPVIRVEGPNSNKAAAEASSGVSERLLFGANVLIGYKVEVQVRDNQVKPAIDLAEHEHVQEACIMFNTLKPCTQVKSGLVYEGIFHTLKFDGDKPFSVVLNYARVIKDPNSKIADGKDSLAEKPHKTFIVYGNELVQISAKDVRMNPEDLASATDYGFETDASISRGRGG